MSDVGPSVGYLYAGVSNVVRQYVVPFVGSSVARPSVPRGS